MNIKITRIVFEKGIKNYIYATHIHLNNFQSLNFKYVIYGKNKGDGKYKNDRHEKCTGYSLEHQGW